MDELLKQLKAARIRCLLAGGQAMRLSGMPRFSMDWDFFIPPRDEENFARLNAVLGGELDLPLVPLGPRGENFYRPTKRAGTSFNSTSGFRACQVLTKPNG